MRRELQSPYFAVSVAVAALLGLVLMIACFGPTDNWAWDPSFYYAQIRSPLVDHDLNFRNETKTGDIDLGTTVTGLQPSLWPVGPGLLWAPFFISAHAAMLTLDPAHADGFGFAYIALVALGSLGYSLAGLLIIYKLCRHFGGRAHALATTLLCLAATPLFYYTFRQPMMAHTTGLFAAAAIVLIYLKLDQRATLSPQSGLLFGVALGLCFLTRWNGLLMGAVPAIYFAAHIHKALARRSGREAGAALIQIGVMLGLFLVTISPQLALWHQLYGSFLALPQGGESFVPSLLPINLPKVFFDTSRGLVFWSPAVLIGMLGVALIPDLKLRLMAALVVLGQVTLIGYRVDWFSGAGFGARYFIELLPFLAIGIVCLLRRLPRGAGWSIAAGALMVALVVHQFVLMHAVENSASGWIDAANYGKGQPIGVRWQLDALVRLLRDPALWLAPRPYVSEDRQTILANALAGVRGPQAYLVTGTALALAPAVVFLLALGQRLVVRGRAGPLFIGIAAYCAAWTVFFITMR
ncbi:MAG: glycosyltransferase family 39 protein [Chloroflexales bacterium]|nr:glycosyltransferase family 39 protein [Chloroflexales bacterium]